MTIQSCGSMLLLAIAIVGSIASSPDPLEALLILVVGGLLFAWLGQPWNFRPSLCAESAGLSLVAAALVLLGHRANVGVLSALGIILLLGSLLKRHLPDDIWPTVRSRLLIMFVALPWLQSDAWMLGWVFRWTGAIAVEWVLTLLGYAIDRQGTTVFSGDVALDVAPACAGLRSLQLLLLAGTVAVAIRRGPSGLPIWIVPVVLSVSWLANTLRVLTLCLGAKTFGVEQVAAGSMVHESIGLAVVAISLFVVVAICPPGDRPTLKVGGST